MGYCPDCGTENSDSVSFCSECGKNLIDGDTKEKKAPCEQCGSDVKIEAIRCPKCGYSPVDDGKTGRKIFTIGGILLSGTIIGAVIGIPMILLSWYIGKKKKQQGATGITPS